MKNIFGTLILSATLALAACSSTPDQPEDSEAYDQDTMGQDGGLDAQGIEDREFGQVNPLSQAEQRDAALRAQLDKVRALDRRLGEELVARQVRVVRRRDQVARERPPHVLVDGGAAARDRRGVPGVERELRHGNHRGRRHVQLVGEPGELLRRGVIEKREIYDRCDRGGVTGTSRGRGRG